MAMANVTLIIEADQETAKDLAEHAGITAIQSSVQELRAHAGDVATWITVVNAATPLIAAFIPYLVERAKRGKITKVSSGGTSFEGSFTLHDASLLQKLIKNEERH